jgi:non-canonical purine NTP pyrophosphatase (RdgB/HAM1 family)
LAKPLTSLLIASNNPAKLSEFEALLQSLPGLRFSCQKDYGMSEADETEHTFLGNARLKVAHAVKSVIDQNLPIDFVMADDSGLCIEALEGRPGVISAHYAGFPKNAQKNIEKVLLEMKDVPDEKRGAFFHTTLVLHHIPTDTEWVFSADWHGKLLREPRGHRGLSYSPIVLIESFGKSAAELTDEERNHYSSRGQAMEKLKNHLISFLK